MGKDNVTPHNPKEKHEWKCKYCSAKGKAATKKDAQLAGVLHVQLMHGR